MITTVSEIGTDELLQSQLQRVLNTGRVALLGLGPVDDLPDAVDVAGLVVEVLGGMSMR
jgi:hypothetical protein